jgi:hypothetical protein
MGFHRRHISNDLVRDMYQQRGITALKGLLSADAFVTELGLASDFIALTHKKINERDCWKAVEELVTNNIYKKEMYSLNTKIPKAEVYKILHNSEYSREQKIMEMKLYLSHFKKILDADGFDYTYVASNIVNEYYAKTK